MQDQAPVTPDYDLGHYLRPLRRHRRLLIAFVLGGLVLGAAYTVLSGATYTSAVTLQVANPPVLPGQTPAAAPVNGRTTGPIDLDTEAQNVKSTAVLSRAISTLHSTAAVGGLRSRVAVTVPPNSTDLRIQCSARAAKAAQACATAVANAYLANRTATEKATIATIVTSTNQQLASINTKIKADGIALAAAAPGTPAHNFAFNTQQSDLNVRTQVSNQLTQLNTANTAPGTIINPAGPGVTSTANKGIPVVTGLIAGLILALATIFGRERFDRYVRHSDDLKHSGVGLVAEIKPPRRRGRRQRSEAAARTRFDQRVASVVAGAFDEHGGVIYVAPVSPEQASDDVAERLGATLASVGHHVEIVRPATVNVVASAAMPSPPPAAIEELAPVDEEPTSSLLGWPSPPIESRPREEPSSTEVVVRTAVTVVHPTVEPAESVPMSIRMRLEAAQRRAQFVIIDGDPAVTDPQAYVLAGLSDATLLTVDPEATLKTDLDEVVDQISVAGCELLGAVIWRPVRNDSRAASQDVGAPTRHNGRRAPHLRKPADADRAAANGSVLPGAPGTHPPRPVDAAH